MQDRDTGARASGPRTGGQDAGGQPSAGGAQRRAARHLDRMIDNQERTEELVRGLDAAPDGDRAGRRDTSVRQLEAMVPPPHERDQVRAMARSEPAAPGSGHPHDTTTRAPRCRWWHRVAGWWRRR